MKTIVDAVNELRGDLNNGEYTGSVYHHTHNYIVRTSDGLSWELSPISSRDEVGTIEEFNQCVAEMSEGLFVPEANNPNLVYDKDGNGYEIGTRYQFSDNGEDWCVDKLHAISKSQSQFVSDTSYYKFIRIDDSHSGTITPPKVKLVDGEAYKVDYLNVKDVTVVACRQIVDDKEVVMLHGIGCAIEYNPEHHTNIIPLVKG